MKTVFYSEDLNKTFDTEEECAKAEKEHAKKLELEKIEKEERSVAAREVELAFRAAKEAENEAYKKLDAFVEKYGSFHYSYTSTTPKNSSLFNLLFGKDRFLL